MTGAAPEPVDLDPRQFRGIKKLRHLLPLLSSLRDSGCARDAAGNRDLHFDQYVTLVLLYLFNPLIDSVRTLRRAAAVERLAEQLGVGRFSLGSFSESCRVFEPQKLKAVIAQLAGQLRPLAADPRLEQHLAHTLTVADGTVLDAVAKVAGAFWLKFQDGTAKHAWKLHVQFEVGSFCAVEAELTDARNSGRSDEKYVLRKKLAPGHCYVTDRWFSQFTLFNEINAVGSSYVCRAKENSAFAVLEERPLGDADLAAGVVRDAVVRMGDGGPAASRPDHPMRVVVVEAEPHAKRGGRKGKTAGPGTKGTIVLLTNLLDVPAEIVALVYRYRWTAGRRSLPHRGVLPLLQADAGLPPPDQPAGGGGPDPDVLRRHRLHADQPVDRAAAGQAHGQHAGLVLHGRGDGGGGAGVPRRAGQHRREAAGQGRAVEKTGVLNDGPSRPAGGRRRRCAPPPSATRRTRATPTHQTPQPDPASRAAATSTAVQSSGRTGLGTPLIS